RPAGPRPAARGGASRAGAVRGGLLGRRPGAVRLDLVGEPEVALGGEAGLFLQVLLDDVVEELPAAADHAEAVLEAALGLAEAEADHLGLHALASHGPVAAAAGCGTTAGPGAAAAAAAQAAGAAAR